MTGKCLRCGELILSPMLNLCNRCRDSDDGDEVGVFAKPKEPMPPMVYAATESEPKESDE